RWGGCRVVSRNVELLGERRAPARGGVPADNMDAVGRHGWTSWCSSLPGLLPLPGTRYDPSFDFFRRAGIPCALVPAMTFTAPVRAPSLFWAGCVSPLTTAWLPT